MPRTTSIATTFKRRVTQNLSLYDELVLAVNLKKKQKSLETMLAEQCVIGLAVLWEAFIHDLIVGYIEERPEVCTRFHKLRLTQSIESKNKALLRWVKINVPRSLSREQIETLVDPDGRNVTADSAESLSTRATQLLSARDAIKFSLAESDQKFLNLVIAIRNYLSHRSAGSFGILKSRLREFGSTDPTSPLNGRLTTVGAYLKERPGNGAETRAKVIGNRLVQVSGRLV